MAVDPIVKRPAEVRTPVLNFGNQPELASYGDSLTGTPTVTAAVYTDPDSGVTYSGTLPTIGTPFICYSVTSFTVTAGGTGYTSAPAVSFSGGTPVVQAVAVATVNVLGAVTAVAIVTGGVYQSAPTVVFTGGGGTAAAATANVAKTTRIAFTVTGGVDGNWYTLTCSCATTFGSTLAEQLLLKVGYD